MSPRPPLGNHSDNHNAYIPSSVQAAMSRELQQKAPAHLQQYMGSDKPTYIPQRAQAELTSYMQKAMPSHLQQYAGAYVQQHVVEPTLRANHAPRQVKAPPPTARAGNLSRSASVPGEQASAQFLNLFQPDAAPGKPSQPMLVQPGEVPVQPNIPGPQPPVINVPGQAPFVAQPVKPADPPRQAPVDHSPYEFIFNPQQPAKPGKFGGSSMLQRTLIAVGGLAVLVIIAAIVASLIGGKSTSATAQLVSVLQEQTELARVAGNGAAASNDEITNSFASSVQLSMLSAKQELSKYMNDTHRKYDTTLLGLKHSKTTDTQLQNAQSNNAYNTTLVNILQQDLASYSQALQTAYKANPGANGRKILNNDFEGAKLLIQQSKQQ